MCAAPTLRRTTLFEVRYNEILEEIGLDPDNWGDPKWRTLYPLVNKEVLSIAHTNAEKVQKWLAEKGIVAFTRDKPKSLERVKAKISEEEQKDENARFFRPVSDLTALRVECSMEKMAEIIYKIQEVVRSIGGCVVVKTYEGRPSTSFDPYEGRIIYYDIAQTLLVNLDRPGIVTTAVEIEVGVPFALFCFKEWANQNGNLNFNEMYDMVKTYLLDRANKKERPWVTEERIWEMVDRTYPDEPPTELRDILERVFRPLGG